MNNITKSILSQLPCKPGDIVYIICNNIITGHPETMEDVINTIYIDREHPEIMISFLQVADQKLSNFGKSIFLTMEEAKEKLAVNKRDI